MNDNKWSESRKQGYVSEFLSLRCAGDVLNIVNPMGAKAAKEITEAMAVIKAMRTIVIKEPMKYTMYDWCAGNALSSVLAAHLLPVKFAVAFDKRRRKRNWKAAGRFGYVIADIKKHLGFYRDFGIITSIHPCGDLAEDVIRIYNAEENIKHLILIPCCKGAMKDYKCPNFMRAKLNKYELWCLYLGSRVAGKYNIYIDKKCTSPCNAVITASKQTNS